MVVKLSYVEHGCSEHNCGGEVIRILGDNGAKLVRKAILTIPGIRIPRHFDTREQAISWATRQGYEVEE